MAGLLIMHVCIAAKDAESKTVAVLYEHRAAPKRLERTKVIDEVISHVPRPPHTVKLKGASKTISIQARAPRASCLHLREALWVCRHICTAVVVLLLAMASE